jgi:GR25 family glycosyltransferase involved in LPS biosynthesis
MKYIISILLIVIVIIFGFFKTIILNENFEDSNTLDIYVITLGKKERLENIKKQQQKINNKIEIFDAVNGKNLDINDLKTNNILAYDNKLSENYNNKMGEIGCYLSHLNIYKKIKKENKKGYTVIFEDDFSINSDNLINNLKNGIDILNSKNIDFDYLFLGNLKDNHGENISDNLYYLDKNINLWGTHAYIINNKNIDKIIDKLNIIRIPIDNSIEKLSFDNVFNTITIYPNLVIQNGELKSTIRI